MQARRPPKGVILDMDSSVSPTHGEQEKSCWNGYYECTRYHPLRFETPHLAGRRRARQRCPATDDPAHRRIMAQALGVVHVLVTRETPEH